MTSIILFLLILLKGSLNASLLTAPHLLADFFNARASSSAETGFCFIGALFSAAAVAAVFFGFVFETCACVVSFGVVFFVNALIGVLIGVFFFSTSKFSI